LFALTEIKISIKRIVYLLCLLILLFLIRNFVALSVMPAVIAYFITRHRKRHSLLVFTTVFICCTAAFFLTSFLPEGFNLPLKTAERQYAFLELKGNSYLPIDTLDGNISSYLNVLPQALNHVFIRPYISETNSALYIFSFAEIALVFFLIIRLVIKPSTAFKQLMQDPLILSFTMIALINYIIIGYTVPFLGAIVRYRSLFEIFFIIVLLALQDFHFNFNFYSKKKTE